MRKWHTHRAETVFDHPLFTLEDRELEAGEDRRRAVVLKTPDWVNVVPLLPADRVVGERVVMVRQWRFGIEAPTLEIPGGVVEEEDLRAACARELLEETGYRAASWRRLGAVHSNPAILDNRTTTFLAEDLTWVEEPRGDGEEEIEVELVPLAEVPGRIARGEISHSLVVAAFYLLGLDPR